MRLVHISQCNSIKWSLFARHINKHWIKDRTLRLSTLVFVAFNPMLQKAIVINKNKFQKDLLLSAGFDRLIYNKLTLMLYIQQNKVINQRQYHSFFYYKRLIILCCIYQGYRITVFCFIFDFSNIKQNSIW